MDHSGSSGTNNATTGGGSGDGWILGLLAAVLAAAAVVWVGAGLAVTLAGERWSATMGDAVRALPRLPSHLADPAGAWPQPAANVVPSAWLYWPSTILVLTVAVMVGRVGWRWWRRFNGPSRTRLGVDVRARFATADELAPLVVPVPVPTGRFVLGRVAGRLVATEDQKGAPMPTPGRFRSKKAMARQGDRGAVAMIGPTRSGKTANVVASLLEWDGPAVVVSVKRDLYDATVTARRAKGAVQVFDPSGVTRLSDAELARWSPLRAAGTPSGAQQAAVALASAIPRAGVDGGADYWVKQAEILLTGLLATASLDKTVTMADVATWVFTRDMPEWGGRPSKIIDILLDASSGKDRHAAGMARWTIRQLDAIWGLEDRVRSSVYATVQTVVAPWLDPTVAGVSSPHPQRGYVDLGWLDRGDNTLFLVAPLHDQRRFTPVLGGLLGDLKDQAYQRDADGVALRKPLLMVIDEAGNMPLSWLPEVVSTCAGIGVLLVTIWQSKAQLDAAYGRLADSVLTNHLTKLVFAGCSDAATLDYVSRLLGDDEVQRRSVSWDTAGGQRRRSISEAPQREALTPFHVLRQAEPGNAVLIHGTLPPAQLTARRWWTDPRLTRLQTGVDPTARFASSVPTAGQRPVPANGERPVLALPPGSPVPAAGPGGGGLPGAVPEAGAPGGGVPGAVPATGTVPT